MSSLLTQKDCTPCEDGVPPLTPQEAEKLNADVPAWDMDEQAQKISRTWKLRDFASAMNFVNGVAALAEEENHHPDVEIHYNKVTLTLWTHKIGGLSENDFILAAKIDVLPEAAGEVQKSENF